MSSLKDIYDATPWLLSNSLNDKFVCLKCIRDKYLRSIIKANLASDKCTYCQRTSKKLIAAELRDLIGPILSGIESEWEDPANVLGYDSAEGGWLGADVYDTDDLSWFIEEEAGITSSELLNDIINELSERQWCKHPGDTDFSDDLSISWGYFSHLIKHSYRYTFFQIDEKIYLGPDPYKDEVRIPPKQFLNVLSQLVNKNKKMIEIIPKGTKIFRARLFKQKSSEKYTAKELGSPPHDQAKASRMSPAGVSIFYGSLDKETAIKEITHRSNGYQYIVMAEFETMTDIINLNLCDTHKPISVFDEKKTDVRRAVKFLKKFSREIRKKVILDGREHIDYVPTQVLTEYFRHLFKHKKNISLDGILYHSSHQKNGINCALFVTNDQCVDDYKTDGGVLKLISQSELLVAQS